MECLLYCWMPHQTQRIDKCCKKRVLVFLSLSPFLLSHFFNHRVQQEIGNDVAHANFQPTRGKKNKIKEPWVMDTTPVLAGITEHTSSPLVIRPRLFHKNKNTFHPHVSKKVFLESVCKHCLQKRKRIATLQTLTPRHPGAPSSSSPPKNADQTLQGLFRAAWSLKGHCEANDNSSRQD